MNRQKWTFEEKMGQFKPFKDEVVSQIEDVIGEEMSLENPIFDIDFREIDKGRITLEDSFNLLTKKILICSTEDLIELFNNMNMEEIEFEVQKHEKDLPEFQSGFTFIYKTNNDEKCYFEILDLENEVLQLSMMIHFKKSWFSSNMEQHFSILKELCDENFQFHKEQEVGKSKIYGWDGGEQMLSLRKLKSDIHQLSFVVGNKKLWDGILEKEQVKSKYYDSGKIKSKETYKSGKPNGLWIDWYENGQKKRQVNFKNGDLDGLETEWYENGQKFLELTIKKGEFNGLYNYWHENGQKDSEGTFKDSKDDGIYTEWYENGQLYRQRNYKDGELVEFIGIWNEDGSMDFSDLTHSFFSLSQISTKGSLVEPFLHLHHIRLYC
jgi:antitoxin component YwqK of YwqJK toxin-antitoxin module